MTQATPQKLLQRFDSPERIKFLTDSLSHSMIKASKQVYKYFSMHFSLSTRNIKQFIREHREMELKRRQQVVNLKKNVNQKKKYDENQLIELQFKLRKAEYDPVFIDKCKTQSSDIVSLGEKRNKRKTNNKFNSGFNAVEVPQNNKTVMNRPKRVSYVDPNLMSNGKQQSPQTLPRIIGIRKKSKSTFENLSTKAISKDFDLSSKLRVSHLEVTPEHLQKSSSILGSSSKIMAKRNTSMIYNNQTEKFINITQDKMMRYIKTLHILVNGTYDYGEPLNEETVNKLLLQRYSVPKANLQNQEELMTIEVEAKTFSLPYSEFISETQVRKSIHRIINMSVKTAQKVVFQLLDLNKNGYIDEKDIIDLVQLSMKIPEIKQDFLKIVRFMRKEDNFSISNAQSNSYRQDSYRQIQKMKDISVRYLSIEATKNSQKGLKTIKSKKLNSKHQRSHTYSSSEITQEQNSKSTIKNDVTMGSCHFDKKKFYSFNESKKKFFNSKKIKEREKFKFSLSFQEFSKIYGDERPLAFYDILKFLFGVRKQDLEKSQMGELSEKLRKENQPKVKARQVNSYEHKNYNVPAIIRDFERRFTCDIEMSKYEEVLDIGKFSQRPDQLLEKEKEKQKQEQEKKQKQKQNAQKAQQSLKQQKPKP